MDLHIPKITQKSAKLVNTEQTQVNRAVVPRCPRDRSLHYKFKYMQSTMASTMIPDNAHKEIP
ncbi:MAG TPA: hypothetical protein VGE93_07090, partial [Bryobacteraceae bacterium]